MSTSIHATLEKSAKSIAEYLNSVSDEDFLATHNSVATNEGVTVNEYLSGSYVEEYFSMCEFSIYSSDAKYLATVVDEISGQIESVSDCITHAANDDSISWEAVA